MSGSARESGEVSRRERAAPASGAAVPPVSWRRKTLNEFARDAVRHRDRNLHPVQPLKMAGIAFLLGCAVGWRITAREDSGAALWMALIAGGVLGLPTFIIAYASQAAGWITLPARVRLGICNRCFRLVMENRETCECGGTFENLDGWTVSSCPACGYDLCGITPGRCPECGAGITEIGPPPDSRLGG